MTRLRTREQLISWLAEELRRLNRRSIARAITEGHIELLGGFALNPPGWIVRVTSEHGRVWTLAIRASFSGYGIRLLKEVPWEKWTGGKTPLYEGDNPARYTYLRGSKGRMNAESD